MQKLKQKISNHRYIAISIIMLIAFGILISIVPYSGDDWAWGSRFGVERLNDGFKGYNGRYFGNLLILVLTRSSFLRAAVTALSYTMLCSLAYFFAKSKGIISLVIAFLMIIITPKNMMTETVVWSSGFSNYIPPLIVEMAYFYIIRNIFSNKIPQFKKYVTLVTALLGIVGSLFMESNTLFNLGISIIIMIYCKIKFNKQLKANIGFFIGSFAGAVIMFSNSAYWNVAINKDEYRQRASGLKGIIKMSAGHTRIIVENIIFQNIALCAIIAVLIVAFSLWYLKNNEKCSRKKKAFICIDSAILSLFTVICAIMQKLYLKDVSDMLDNEKLVYSAVVVFSAGVYILSVLGAAVLLADDIEVKSRLLFFILCTLVMCLPLLVVEPIGARCMFAPRFMMVMFLITWVEYMARIIKPTKTAKRAITLAALAYCLAGIVFLFSVYIPIHNIDKERAYYASLQQEAGVNTIYIRRIDPTRVHSPNPFNTEWSTRYESFYDIEIGKKIIVLDDERFDTFIERYEKYDKSIRSAQESMYHK